MYDDERYDIDSPQDDGAILEFKAEDAGAALLTAQKRAPSTRVEMWEDGQPVCELKRTKLGEDEIWIVGQAA